MAATWPPEEQAEALAVALADPDAPLERLADLAEARQPDLAMLSVALRELRNLA